MPRFLTYVDLPDDARRELDEYRQHLGSPPMKLQHTTVYMVPALPYDEQGLLSEVARVASQTFAPAIELNTWKIFSDTDNGHRLLALEGKAGDLRSIHMDVAAGQRQYINWDEVVKPTDLDGIEDRVFSYWGSPYFGSMYKPHTSVAIVDKGFLPRRDDTSIVWKPSALLVARKDKAGWTTIGEFEFAKPY